MPSPIPGNISIWRDVYCSVGAKIENQILHSAPLALFQNEHATCDSGRVLEMH
jgi:hypothetical protein